MSGKVVAGILLGAGALVGAAFLLGGSAGVSLGGYKNVHDLTGKIVNRVDIWYNEPVKILQVRARGKFILPGGTSEKLFRDGNTYLSLMVGVAQGKSRDAIDNLTGLAFPNHVSDLRFDIVSNFDTGNRTVRSDQKAIDNIGMFVYCEAPASREIIPIQDLILEVIKSKQVGTNVDPTFANGSSITKETYPFGNGVSIVQFTENKVLSEGGEISVELVTDMKGKDSGTVYQSGFATVRFLDENNLPVYAMNRSGIKGSVSIKEVLDRTLTVRSIQISLAPEIGGGGVVTNSLGISAAKELIKITGTLTIDVQVGV